MNTLWHPIGSDEAVAKSARPSLHSRSAQDNLRSSCSSVAVDHVSRRYHMAAKKKVAKKAAKKPAKKGAKKAKKK